VSFAAITLYVASQRMFIVVSLYFIMTQSGNFWIHSCMLIIMTTCKLFTEMDHKMVYMVASAYRFEDQ
jgi:hypothetical protein